MEFRIKRAPRIEAEMTVPGDKSISHRAVIISALSNGVCVLRGFLASDDCLRTVQALRAVGIKIEHPEPDMLIVHGKRRLLTAPSGEIDCGNSATTMRLLIGLLAGQKFDSVLVGGASLGAITTTAGNKTTTAPGHRGVSFATGEPVVTDGPFTEAKEVLGGYWMIDVKSKDEAVAWASRCPASENEVIEVRQVHLFLEIDQ